MNATIDWGRTAERHKNEKLTDKEARLRSRRGTYNVVIVDRDTDEVLHCCAAHSALQIIRELN